MKFSFEEKAGFSDLNDAKGSIYRIESMEMEETAGGWRLKAMLSSGPMEPGTMLTATTPSRTRSLWRSRGPVPIPATALPSTTRRRR